MIELGVQCLFEGLHITIRVDHRPGLDADLSLAELSQHEERIRTRSDSLDADVIAGTVRVPKVVPLRRVGMKAVNHV